MSAPRTRDEDTIYYGEGGTNDHLDERHPMDDWRCKYCGHLITMPCEKPECIKAKKAEREIRSGIYAERKRFARAYGSTLLDEGGGYVEREAKASKPSCEFTAHYAKGVTVLQTNEEAPGRKDSLVQSPGRVIGSPCAPLSSSIGERGFHQTWRPR